MDPSESRVPPGVVRLREQRSAVTRRAILQAARALFSEQGYAATPVKLLAERAGVAVQTIYGTFGSKAGVLAGMPDLIDEEAGVHELVAALREERDPGAALALYARLRRQIRERCGDIVRTLRSGAAVDPEIAASWAEGLRRRWFGLERLMENLEHHGHLRGDLDAARAAAIAGVVVCDEACDVLVEQRGWSFDEYEAWMTETLATLVLRPPAAR
jgi:AcrR family transcriptional regulator